MSNPTQAPWASGPGEILRHGLELLRKDSDTNRRLAMISIDNAVELMIKTYLGLPKRVSGLSITRKEFQELSETFPGLLDGLEKHASAKLVGVDLGAIEWYHRLRNELYHQGNGLTVERDKVEVYAELANLLFKNLFGFDLLLRVTPQTELFGEFMTAWVKLEEGLRSTAETHSLLGESPRGIIDVTRFLQNASILDSKARREIDDLRKIRNQIVHGGDFRDILTPELIKRVKHFARLFSEDDDK